jgi:hypothetical protein
MKYFVVEKGEYEFKNHASESVLRHTGEILRRMGNPEVDLTFKFH